MSDPIRSFLGLILISLLGTAPGCATRPSGPPSEDEDIEAQTMRESMLKTRARLEPKGGVILPINSRYDVGYGGGIKGQIEAVEKWLWFGLAFDYASIDTKDPLQVVSPTPPAPNLGSLKTEQQMDHYDRYQLMLTFDYEIPTGAELYYPIFRIGLGLGAVGINPKEAPGNNLVEFDTHYSFVAQPTLGFRFPLHENVGLFVEGQYNFIPEAQLTGKENITGQDQNVDIGDKVEFSTVNLLAGISFEW